MSFSPPAARRPGFASPRRDLSPAHLNNINNQSRPRRQVNGMTDSARPLLPAPPLAGPEVVELDDRKSTNQPQPGVDDGFFTTTGSEAPNPDAEAVPKDPEPVVPDDETDVGRFPANHPRPRVHPDFPYAPGFGTDVYNIPDYAPTEFGGSGESIPDVNIYQHKKTLAQGMMDLALFSANANQLRYVLESYDRHPYYYPSIVLISFSLMFQVAVGAGLIWNARYNVKDKKEICIANKVNNFTVIGIFLVTVINVFVSAFGVANAPSTNNT